MKNKLILLFASIQFSIQVQAQSKNNIPPDEVSIFPKCVFYEIFIKSFCDSNGDSIGDLNGITAKLDYLQNLGIKGLWITPVNSSPSYHKYDVTDYYEIDKEYGTIKDFKNLLKEAHKRIINVLMDMAINHCSWQHKWFKEALTNKKSQYRNYFVWKNAADVKTEKDHWYVIRYNKPENLLEVKKFEEGEQAYYGFFSGEMPDLNYDNTKVRSEMIKVGKYWLYDVGVDGYRLDAAKWIFPPGQETKNYEWWKEYTAAMKAVKPNAFFVGEITDSYSIAAPYLKNALNSVFNFDLGFEIIKGLKAESDSGIADLVKSSRNAYIKASPTFIDATFITNHDQNRIGSEVKGHVRKMKLASAILLTLPGSQFIYYGEEIGMLGMKPDEHIREPFLWNLSAKDNERCKWLTPLYSSDSTVIPLALQINNANSTYNHYKKLIKLRNTSLALNEGDIVPVNLNDVDLLIYERNLGDEELLVMHNLTGKSKTITMKSFRKKYARLIYSSKLDTEFDGLSIILLPFATAVIQ